MARSNAERQAALRKRRATVDRAALEDLVAAVEAAAAAGFHAAQKVRTGTPDGLLRNLARWFRTIADEGKPLEEDLPPS